MAAGLLKTATEQAALCGLFFGFGFGFGVRNYLTITLETKTRSEIKTMVKMKKSW
jgi:hypothetical protein